MKIYDVRTDIARRLILIDGEIGSVQECGYLFACRDKEDIIVIWEYVKEAVARGIEVFQSVSKDIITKVDERGAITLKLPIFTFVGRNNAEDETWIKGVITRILEDEERHIADKERRYGDGTSHSGS